MEVMVDTKKSQSQNFLLDNWVAWAHLPNNNNWDLSSYIEIGTINTAEDTCKYVENFPDILIKNCMLFIMRKGINPYWEDQQNIKGGCFSYKVSNKIVVQCWKNLSYLLLGETLTNANISHHINGITISPKKNFCIIKIWLKEKDIYNNLNIHNYFNIPENYNGEIIFKNHKDD